MIKDTFKDMFKYLPSYIIPAIVGIISLPIITRFFPPADYGNYILVLTTISLLSTVATAWVSSSVIRFFPDLNKKNKMDDLYSITFKFTVFSIVIVTLICSVILLFLRTVFSESLFHLLNIGILLFSLSSAMEVLLNFLRAKRMVTWFSLIRAWQSIAGLVIGMGVLVFAFGFGIEGLLLGNCISIVIALPIAYKYSIGKVSFKINNVIPSLGLEMAKYGLPITAVNIASWILMVSDRYLLGVFRNNAEVGIYSASCNLSEHGILMITSLFMMALAPIGFNIWENSGVKESQEFLTKSTRYYILIGFPAVVGLSVLAKPIMAVFTSDAYFSGYRIIPLVAFSAFLIGIENNYGLVLAFCKKTNFTMLYNIAGAVVNLGLNIIFIPKYGFVAAAATTLIACIFILIMIIFISRHFFIWQFPLKSMIRSVSASAIMGLLVYFICRNLAASNLVNLILETCSGIVIYLLGLLLLGELQPGETKALRILAFSIFKR